MKKTFGPRVDWGDALAIPTFYGREQEMSLLSNWIMQVRCSVVSVLGMGGIGKSALAVKTMYNLAEQFEVVIFRSLRDAPSCEALLDDCLQVLSPQSGPLPTTLEQRLTLLLEHLGKLRTLGVCPQLEQKVGIVKKKLSVFFELRGRYSNRDFLSGRWLFKWLFLRLSWGYLSASPYQFGKNIR